MQIVINFGKHGSCDMPWKINDLPSLCSHSLCSLWSLGHDQKTPGGKWGQNKTRRYASLLYNSKQA